MNKDNGLPLNNPLPCIFIANIICFIAYKTFQLDKVLAFTIASAFFVLLYFYYDMFISLSIGLFFLLFFININNF